MDRNKKLGELIFQFLDKFKISFKDFNFLPAYFISIKIHKNQWFINDFIFMKINDKEIKQNFLILRLIIKFRTVYKFVKNKQ